MNINQNTDPMVANLKLCQIKILLPYAKVIISRQDAWLHNDITATLIAHTHAHAEQAKSGLTKKAKLAAEEQYHVIKRDNDRITEWPCAVRQT